VAALDFQSKDQTCLAIDGREDNTINMHHQRYKIPSKWDIELLPKYH
jgi:hypothetical protein